MTVQDDILYPALRHARVTGGPGRQPSPDQITDAFQALNRMIDSWSTLRGLIYSIERDEYTLTPPKPVYTIGRAAGADFVADRPTRINDANVIVRTGGSQIYIPMRILDAGEWAQIRLRDYLITFPTAMYPDYSSPNTSLYMLGIPTGSPGLELWTWQQTEQFQSETDPVIIPPGYLSAAVLCLAVELGGMFGTTAAMSPTIFADAKKALAMVKGLNMPSPTVASADAGTRSRPKADFSYLSGGLP